ncbi:solute symporter family protein [Pseudonocardia endophytica]|uniref:Cation/acetate symporter n=1 Tax=Pseudonocardia endophytica TaxID=401976 RepID=A0A4R1HP11_PSEEN|nr:cation acetate symporter [Pseudonocardia endophytica]TCK22375.1 cation/acetate symporter [Pseudonocardia endophytica]
MHRTSEALAQAPEVGSPVVNIAVFGVLVAVTLVVVVRVGRTNRTASDYYTGGHSFTGPQNGVAIAGDYLSAASFLGVAGLTAQFGYDGFMLSVGALVTWLVALLLVAELLRNTGRYTMGDVLAYRTRQGPVRAAAAVATLVVSFFYLFTQLVGAGGLIALLLHIPNADRVGQSLVIAATGAVMIFYVLAGGMKGTTWVQIIKAGLLMAVTLVLAFWVLGRYGFDFSALLGDVVRRNAEGEALLAPGLQNPTATSKLEYLSQTLALVLGTAALPHILMRFYTVPTAVEARRSVVWAIWLIGGFYLALVVVGFGATALVGSERIATAPGGSNAAVPLLAFRLGGELVLGLVAAVAFATILAVVAGLTITASASFAHDVYARLIKRGNVTQQQELRVARRTALVVGAAGIGGAIVANGQNVGVLVILAFAVGASANLPTILYSLFWKRFNTTGALFSIYGGILLSVGLIVLSPAVSGTPKSMLPDVDVAVFPLSNPGLVSIPASFLLGAIGTFLGRPDAERGGRFAEMEVRSLTGARPAPPSVPAAAEPETAAVPAGVFHGDGSAPDDRTPRTTALPRVRTTAPARYEVDRGRAADPVTKPVRSVRRFDGR